MICARFTKRICLALALCALIAAFLACAADAPGANSGVPAPRATATRVSPPPEGLTHGSRQTSRPSAPTPTPEIWIETDRTWYVSPSLEEQILDSDVIVRASLVSATAVTETVPSGEGISPTYRPVHELRFTVHEYLQGTGPAQIVVVRGEHTYATDQEALTFANRFLSERNTTWDNQQGVLFLKMLYTP